MPDDHDDPVRAALEAQGLALAPVPLFKGRMDLGWRAGWAFEKDGAEIVYKLHDPRTVLVYRLRRLDPRPGLKNAFAGLVWFLEFLHERPELGVTRAMGLVRTREFRDFGGLDDERLRRYLIRWLGGRTVRFDYNDWLYLDLVDYRRPRHRRHATAEDHSPSVA